MSRSSPVATRAACDALVPTGALRVGLYAGSPTSWLAADERQGERGVGYLLGRALAQCLALPFAPVIHPRNAQLLKAVAADEVDVVFTNATSERAKTLHFSPPLLALDKGVLVNTDSPVRTLAEATTPERRIGFSAGSTTAVEFGVLHPQVTLIAVQSLPEAAALFAAGALDGFATNNAILGQLAQEMGGGRIVDGAWGAEHLALGIPLSRGAARDFLQQFAAWAVKSGSVDDAVARSGL